MSAAIFLILVLLLRVVVALPSHATITPCR